MMAFFTPPEVGASLILSFRPTKRIIIIVGTGRLAASRALNVLEAGAIPVIVASKAGPSEGSQKGETSSIGVDSAELRWRIDQGQCRLVACPSSENDSATEADGSLSSLDRLESRWRDLLDDVDGHDRSLFAVCVTDTLHSGSTSGLRSSTEIRHKARLLKTAEMLRRLCHTRRIPINVADQPDLCDFSFPATHRFPLHVTKNANESGPSRTSLHKDSTGIHGREDLLHRRVSSLQIAVTTNGQGCRLAGRIRREIVSTLPKNVGNAVDCIGQLRNLARQEADAVERTADKTSQRTDTLIEEGHLPGGPSEEEDDQSFYSTPLNSPVPSTSIHGLKHYFEDPKGLLREAQSKAIAEEERKRRMRWVAQMSEYWPIDYIGNMSQGDMLQALDHFKEQTSSPTRTNEVVNTDRGESDELFAWRGRPKGSSLDAGQVEARMSVSKRTSSQHNLELRAPLNSSKNGQIILVGSGPGHPGLLTAMAFRMLTSKHTDVVLSDKLVPASILSLIPASTTLHIARKFPGNAEGAQSELISLAIEAAEQGKTVIRLKQGDPFIYGRGGEEVLAFKRRGLDVSVIPGISSAIAAPLLLGMPVTQRGAADTLVLCTGVGRGGKQVGLPGYERGRSLVILMGVARIRDVINTLRHGWTSALELSNCSKSGNNVQDRPGDRGGEPYPPYLPIAVIERASSSDQRSIASTLDKIEEAIQDCGEQRPPGMMLVGWAVLALEGGPEGNVDVLDEGCNLEHDPEELERRDRRRIDQWLGLSSHKIKEGLDDLYSKEYSSLHAVTARARDQDVVRNEVMRRSQEWAPPRYGQSGVPCGGWGPGEPSVSNAR